MAGSKSSANYPPLWCVTVFLLVLIPITKCGTSYNTCQVKLDLSVCSLTNPENFTTGECHQGPICTKHFNIAYMTHKPYSAEILIDLLRMCCGNCLKSSIISNFSKVSHITPELLNTSHFVFPVLGTHDSEYLYGYRFLPLIETPSVYYITYKNNNLVYSLIVSCVNMWPLFLVCALMVVISGFICWLCEMNSNKEEFPSSFATGWFEGIWWSFISMTTVGYGDKTPKSVAGRLLSILWIIVGITSFSLITATLTSEIVAANSLPPPKIEDANVGVIRHHTYEGILIAKQGGILHDVDPPNLMDGVRELTKMLDNKTIDGFLLDRYELMLFYKYFQNDSDYKREVDYLRTNTLLTSVSMKEQYLYGALVKDEEDYRFLEGFVSSNRNILNSCTRLFLSMYSREVKVAAENVSLFSTKGEMFWPSFVACSIMVALCVLVGGTYEVRRQRAMHKSVCEGGLLSSK